MKSGSQYVWKTRIRIGYPMFPRSQNVCHNSPVSNDTGLSGLTKAVTNRITCESEGGFFMPGATYYGGTGGKTERFAGALASPLIPSGAATP